MIIAKILHLFNEENQSFNVNLSIKEALEDVLKQQYSDL